MPNRRGIGNRSRAVRVARVTICIAAVLAAAAMQSRSPVTDDSRGASRGWVPDAPDTVVLRLERSDALDELIDLRKRLDEQPGDVAAASRYAKLALQHYANTGDARFVGYAEGALRHWKDNRSPPAPIWLMRGRILQTQHRFSAAAEELDGMLERYSDSLEAMLLAADAWRRAGAIEKARSRCAGLALAGRADLAQLCAADVLLSMGDAEKALRAARIGHSGSEPVTAGVAQWALALRADAAATAGRFRAAESNYRKALTLPGAGIALHVAYADLLLRDDRPAEVMDVLAGLPDADAVLLRRAIAAKRLGLREFERYRARLQESFADARALGAARLHLREQAMFELHVADDPAAACQLARQNWEIQKGPEDAAILVEAAEAAGAPDASQAVVAWRQQF